MERRLPLVLLIACVAATVASFIGATDRLTWWLEAFPVVAGVPLLLVTYRRFPLTNLLYGLMFLHALVLLYGAHYTYAETPFGFWLRDTFGLERNPFDRIGHFMQGFEPAILAREILIRKRAVNGRGWLFLIVCAICLAFSACYEFFEWWAALAHGSAADAFLATQGDVWDTQWDMFLALCGAIAAQSALGSIHDRQLGRNL